MALLQMLIIHASSALENSLPIVSLFCSLTSQSMSNVSSVTFHQDETTNLNAMCRAF